MMSLRKWILDLAYPVLKEVGHWHSPWSRKKMRQEDVLAILAIAEPGDILVVQTRGEFSDLCIPGFWKHVAMFGAQMEIIEAVDPVVRSVAHVYDFFMRKDYVALVRSVLPVEVRTAAAKHVETFLAKPYDYSFDMPGKDGVNEAFYCAELPYWAFKAVYAPYEFELREVMGVKTIKPEDYWLAKKHFTVLWTNRPS